MDPPIGGGGDSTTPTVYVDVPYPQRTAMHATKEYPPSNYGYYYNDKGPPPSFSSSSLDFFFANNKLALYLAVLLTIIALLIAILVIGIIIMASVVSSHRGTIYSLVTRMDTVENLARNVNDASQVMRRALGERSIDDPDTSDFDRANNNKDKKKQSSSWSDWLKDRGPDEEALITDNAVRTIVRGIRAIVKLVQQADEAQLLTTGTRLATHVDEIISGPQMANILQTTDHIIRHPQAKKVAQQTIDLLEHVEGALLPVLDALAEEVRQRLLELMQSGESSMTGEEFRKMIREWMDITHKIGTGLRDLVIWYRSGGPQEAATLLRHASHTGLQLAESPAAASLVDVLGGIDWRDTGEHISEASHNVAAILKAVNDAGTVDSGDRLIRAVASFLENPSTIKVMNVLPDIAANATALLAQNNTQTFITHTSALMARTDAVLSEAEASRTIERAAEFMSSLRLLLNALVIGGMHLQVGETTDRFNSDATMINTQSPFDNNDEKVGATDEYLERGDITKHQHQQPYRHDPKEDPSLASLVHNLKITGYEPERTRELRHMTQLRQQRQQHGARGKQKPQRQKNQSTIK